MALWSPKIAMSKNIRKIRLYPGIHIKQKNENVIIQNWEMGIAFGEPLLAPLWPHRELQLVIKGRTVHVDFIVLSVLELETSLWTCIKLFLLSNFNHWTVRSVCSFKTLRNIRKFHNFQIWNVLQNIQNIWWSWNFVGRYFKINLWKVIWYLVSSIYPNIGKLFLKYRAFEEFYLYI